nr:S8 family serine peptidase [Oscillochloris sp. ZM17-4]
MGGTIANNSGYDGSTQIAAVADTGIGGGTDSTAHRDIPASRITAIYNWPGVTDSCFKTITNDGSIDVDSGHGTHVAGSVLSGGTPGTGVGKGVAPAAHLVFQSTENYVTVSSLCKSLYGYTNGYYLTGLNDLNGLFLQAYNAGARVHANSWGSSQAGVYTANSVTTDNFIWGHRDFTITFSAGNSGADANADGVVDNDSIGSPATAKNVITIGASEGDRQGNYQCDTGLTYVSADTAYQSGQTCSSMGGVNFLGTPRQRWGFTANPIADDPTGGNAQQMAAFSSRGPTDDGRIKPDVVAPGTWILSTYSDNYQQGYDPSANPRNGAFQSDGWGIPLNAYYKYFGGTSMANPLAAGAATVVRDFYQKAYSANASAALVKATLINSAVDLLDENNDGVNDNDFPIPNVHEGWGLINLAAATDGTAEFVDNTAGLSTGGTASSSYAVPGGAPFKVSLVWSDYPSTTTASVNLVNNLNLTVTSPTGTVYRGNVFSGGWSQTGGSADAVNNVENVYVQSAAAGTWTVTVTGANVPQGPQPFALVVRGATVAPPPPPPGTPGTLSATAASSSQIGLSWGASSGTVDSYKVERCQGAGCSSFAQVGTATTTSFSDSGLTAGTSYSYRVRASNASGDSGYSNTASATTGSGPTNTGFLSPSANAAVTSGSGDNNGYQTTPTNAYDNDGLYAVDTNSGSGTSTSCTNNRKDRHIFYNYNVAVPGGATVSGIEVRLDAKADSTTGAPKICVELSSDGGATWTAAKTTTTLSTAEATYIVGGAADTWGRSWTGANLGNSSFRVRLTNVASNTSRDFSLDWVSVQVTYQ